MRVGVRSLFVVALASLVACRAEDRQAAVEQRAPSPVEPPESPEPRPERGPSPAATSEAKSGKRGPMLASTKSLTEEMSSAEIEEVIDANLARFVPCTKVDAVVTVRATIAPDGRVLEATAAAADPDDPLTRDCVAKALRQLTFPKSKRARPTPVTFDLTLKPTGM